jgi:glutamate racemase
MRPLIHDALAPYAEGKYTHLLLGCTHYPLVQELFNEVVHELGMQVAIVDPAEAVAHKVCTRFVTEGQGTTRFLLSEESAYFKKLADTADFGEVRLFEVV